MQVKLSVSAQVVSQAQPKVSRPRVTIANPEVEVTPQLPHVGRPRTVAADIEAAMVSDSTVSKEERSASLLPGDDVLTELGSPVTQLQARLSQAKKAFSELREGRRS